MSVYSAEFRDAIERYDLRGFEVEGQDGTIGKVDDASYERGDPDHLVVDTGLFGKKFALPAGVVRRIDVEGKTIVVAVTKEQVKNGPEYDPDRPLDDDTRSRLAQHYGLSEGSSAAVTPSREDGDREPESDVRSAQPVPNTVHNLIQTLSVKLDSAARYALYRDDARQDGREDSAVLFARLEERDRESIRDLLECLRNELGGDDQGRSVGSVRTRLSG
jgi:hypothetical protein